MSNTFKWYNQVISGYTNMDIPYDICGYTIYLDIQAIPGYTTYMTHRIWHMLYLVIPYDISLDIPYIWYTHITTHIHRNGSNAQKMILCFNSAAWRGHSTSPGKQLRTMSLDTRPNSSKVTTARMELRRRPLSATHHGVSLESLRSGAQYPCAVAEPSALTIHWFQLNSCLSQIDSSSFPKNCVAHRPDFGTFRSLPTQGTPVGKAKITRSPTAHYTHKHSIRPQQRYKNHLHHHGAEGFSPSSVCVIAPQPQ